MTVVKIPAHVLRFLPSLSHLSRSGHFGFLGARMIRFLQGKAVTLDRSRTPCKKNKVGKIQEEASVVQHNTLDASVMTLSSTESCGETFTTLN